MLVSSYENGVVQNRSKIYRNGAKESSTALPERPMFLPAAVARRLKATRQLAADADHCANTAKTAAAVTGTLAVR